MRSNSKRKRRKCEKKSVYRKTEITLVMVTIITANGDTITSSKEIRWAFPVKKKTLYKRRETTKQNMLKLEELEFLPFVRHLLAVLKLTWIRKLRESRHKLTNIIRTTQS